MRLIDADALKKKIEEVQYTQEFCIEHQIDYSVSMQMLGMVIDNAPTIEAERPHGEWIKGREISRTMLGPKVQHIEYKDYTCSNCGLVLDYLLYHFDGSPFYKFCPECGTEMRS